MNAPALFIWLIRSGDVADKRWEHGLSQDKNVPGMGIGLKISFYQQAVTETETQHTKKAQSTHTEAGSVRAAGTYFTENGRGWLETSGRQGEKGKTLIELQQEAANTNVAVRQDYMTLMSNTMSEEDYAKLQEEGFDFGSLKPEEAVTIVDKIKAELVRAGKQIAGYTDTVDLETLTAALGSQMLAQAVTDSFRAADVPLTEENLEATARAWDMASRLKPLEAGSLSYLLDNELSGEIWNLYLAQNSGAGRTEGRAPRFYEEEVQGYYAESAGRTQGAELRGEIEKVLEQSGRETNQKNLERATWILERALPLTEENLDRLEELEKLELPVTEKQFARGAAAAVAEGQNPVRSLLTDDRETFYEKAVRLESYYLGEDFEELSMQGIISRRQLEEVRLHMTAEVNVRLLKSGFAIDTAPMEELIEALRSAERELAESYFPEDAQALAKYETYRRTNEAAEQLPMLPAQILGSFAEGQEGISLREFHQTGSALRERYQKAGKSYEALMTIPRRDMGDSITKAFANVDDILTDLNVELSEENRRAARILGYNRMELTPENLERVQAADRQVQSVIEKLTPAATLKMIRDGINPLEKSFGELEEYFTSLPREYRKEAESYSRFLYGLEQNRSISEAERESYIGIYRLVRQIEKSDGAAVGALVNAGAELHFSNLLSALRSKKAAALDVRASEEFGSLTELVREGRTISEQVARGFADKAGVLLKEAADSGEPLQGCEKEWLSRLRMAVQTAKDAEAQLLEKARMPVNSENLLAAEALTGEVENLLAAADRRLRAEKGQKRENAPLSETKGEHSEKLWEKLDEKADFAEEYCNMTREALTAVEEATLQADKSLDVREMQLMHKQLTVMSVLADREEFFVPMYVGDVLTRVHLTFDRSGEAKGSVKIGVQLSEESYEAYLFMEEGSLQGLFTGRTQKEVMKLQQIADTFKEEASESWKVGSIRVARAAAQTAEVAAGSGQADNAMLYRVAKVFLYAVQQGVGTDEN